MREGRMEGEGCRSAVLTPGEAERILLISLASYLVVSRLLRLIAGPDGMILLRMAAGEAALVIPGLICLYRKKGTDGLRSQLGENPSVVRSAGPAIAAIVCSYPVVLILNLISMHFVRNHVAQVLPQILDRGLATALFFMALLPALAEEFLFRGILYRSYRQADPLRGALRSALLFGLMHMDLNQIPYAFFLGIVLALMTEAAGTIGISVFMHALFNGASVAINYFAQPEPSQSMTDAQAQQAVQELLRESISLQGVMVIVFMLCFCLFFLFLVLRKAFKINGKRLGELFSGSRSRKLPADPSLALFTVAVVIMAFRGI